MNLRKILVFTAIAAVPAGLPVSGNAAPEKQDSLAVQERTGIIEESVISSSRDTRQIEGVMSGNLRLNAENFSGLPKFLGTNDILKTLQLIPGVQTSGELDSGIYIRGSDPGQTLVMLDGATIYAPIMESSHATAINTAAAINRNVFFIEYKKIKFAVFHTLCYII